MDNKKTTTTNSSNSSNSSSSNNTNSSSKPATKANAKATAPKAEPKSHALNASNIRFNTTMGMDKGMPYHWGQVTVRKAASAKEAKAALEAFLTRTNEAIATCGLPLAPATLDKKNASSDEEGNIQVRILFPKVKGHSKDGYAMYKKCMTDAKVDIRTEGIA